MAWLAGAARFRIRPVSMWRRKRRHMSGAWPGAVAVYAGWRQFRGHGKRLAPLHGRATRERGSHSDLLVATVDAVIYMLDVEGEIPVFVAARDLTHPARTRRGHGQRAGRSSVVPCPGTARSRYVPRTDGTRRHPRPAGRMRDRPAQHRWPQELGISVGAYLTVWRQELRDMQM